MYDLGEIEEGRLSQLKQLLAFQITCSTLARYCGHHGSAMLGERGAFLGQEFTWMYCFEATRNDANAVRV